MSDELGTGAENTWCPGCGNFGILNSVKNAVKELEERGIEREKLLISQASDAMPRYSITST